MDHLTSLRNRYLNLLISSLTGVLTKDPNIDYWHTHEYDPLVRYLGQDAPDRSATMIGTVRMRHLRYCCESVIMDGIPGDFIETGVWRGGACILMRGVLEVYDDKVRRVFAADSFQGLPSPNPDKYSADYGTTHHEVEYAKVPQREVEDNFRKYGLLDDRVVFIPGWFRDTLSGLSQHRFSVLRLDGDMYESTIQALENLYPSVSNGGYVIIDDLNLPECKKAVSDYRKSHAIKEPLLPLDGCAGWWRVDS